VLDGDVLGTRRSLMNFPNRLSAQTCFVTPEAAAETARRLQVWDPLPHEALKVFAYQAVRAPCVAADFQTLSLKSGQSAIRWLLDKTLATTADRSDLNLTRAEAEQLATCVKGNPDPQDVSACWVELLRERVAVFQRQGFDGLLPYEANGATVLPATQLREMLREQPAVARQFATLLHQSGLLGGERAKSLTPTLAFTKGTDRIVYGAILLQEVKKVVRCFQDDLKVKQLR
jgi:hypothetical protein